jgi:hypothetical protein
MNNITEEGILGKVPQNLESIAELLLFDSGINVYEDAYVYFPSDGGMFNT